MSSGRMRRYDAFRLHAVRLHAVRLHAVRLCAVGFSFRETNADRWNAGGPPRDAVLAANFTALGLRPRCYPLAVFAAASFARATRASTFSRTVSGRPFGSIGMP